MIRQCKLQSNKVKKILLSFLIITSISACTTGKIANDPMEVTNRKAHSFNKSFDKNILKPASKIYANIMGKEESKILNNFVNNLSVPKSIINNALQLDVENFVGNSFRFAINSTIGMAGTLDFASEMGLSNNKSDFGQTLYKWGVKEGVYLELPFLGPHTMRSLSGSIIDFTINPLGNFIPKEIRHSFYPIKGLELIEDRHEYAYIIDTTLYDSSDSYIALKSYYLQNRRYTLDGTISEADLENPYADE